MFSGVVLHPRLTIASKCVPGVEGISVERTRFSTDLVFPGPGLGVKKRGMPDTKCKKSSTHVPN